MRLKSVTRRFAVAGVASAVVLGLGVGPASAATGSIYVANNGYQCTYTASKGSNYARATAGSCRSVGAYVLYVSAGGTVYAGISEISDEVATGRVPAGTSWYSGHTAGKPGEGSLGWQKI